MSTHDDRPVAFPAMARQDEIRSLEIDLQAFKGARNEILADIDFVHDQMLARVTKAVADFEREFWATDYHVNKSMDRLNALRAENTPLRTQIWDLQAKIEELKRAK